MPIIEDDPWRQQYFAHVACPESVFIPTDDRDCYALYPELRWMFNKLTVCVTQGINAAPHGITPTGFPVFSKPIYNLRGMGLGSRVMNTLSDYETYQMPGHLWMQLLTGEHLSTDVAVIAGNAVWWRHTEGKPGAGGTFDYWTVHKDHRPALEEYCGAWIANHLPGYTGMMNIETIGGRIIEAHLRFSDQWPDLYGMHWVEAVVRLYQHGIWDFDDTDRKPGFSVILFAPHGIHYKHPPGPLQDEIRQMPHISSVQVTFHEDKAPESHSMPPGGFRLAVINCLELDAGIKARRRLQEFYNLA